MTGRNSMGKTNTVRSIIGVTPPRSEKIRFTDKAIQGISSYKIAQMEKVLSTSPRVKTSNPM
jgi:branched-chain amino acid transport system ATP-binding protein